MEIKAVWSPLATPLPAGHSKEGILNSLLSSWFWAYSLPGNDGKQHKGQAGIDPVYESFSF